MASRVLITDPILNCPFVEPTRHFAFDDDGITDQILDGRELFPLFLWARDGG